METVMKIKSIDFENNNISLIRDAEYSLEDKVYTATFSNRHAFDWNKLTSKSKFKVSVELIEE